MYILKNHNASFFWHFYFYEKGKIKIHQDIRDEAYHKELELVFIFFIRYKSQTFVQKIISYVLEISSSQGIISYLWNT